jgi:hypothetical protein
MNGLIRIIRNLTVINSTESSLNLLQLCFTSVPLLYSVLMSSVSPFIVLDRFCLRQFLPGGFPHLAISPNELIKRVNEHYSKLPQLVDGYAPFCKHIFIPNFIPNLAASYVPITANNENRLKSKYEARTEKELPVLVRYFDKSTVQATQSTYLDIILYSREQIAKENAAMQSTAVVAQDETKSEEMKKLDFSKENDTLSTDKGWEWGIVSVKPQLVDYETPMQPITMLRNALGVNEGGSGIPLDRTKYLKAVEFWTKNASVV